MFHRIAIARAIQRRWLGVRIARDNRVGVVAYIQARSKDDVALWRGYGYNVHPLEAHVRWDAGRASDVGLSTLTRLSAETEPKEEPAH